MVRHVALKVKCGARPTRLDMTRHAQRKLTLAIAIVNGAAFISVYMMCGDNYGERHHGKCRA